MTAMETEYARHQTHLQEVQASLANEQEAHRTLAGSLESNMAMVQDYLSSDKSPAPAAALATSDRTSTTSPSPAVSQLLPAFTPVVPPATATAATVSASRAAAAPGMCACGCTVLVSCSAVEVCGHVSMARCLSQW
jgi:hypothetical protein